MDFEPDYYDMLIHKGTYRNKTSTLNPRGSSGVPGQIPPCHPGPQRSRYRVMPWEDEPTAKTYAYTGWPNKRMYAS